MSDISSKPAQRSAFSVREICYSGLFAAVIAIMAQISIPMPGGVPMTMQTFAITLAAVVLGAKLSTVSCVIYLLLGAVGVPVARRTFPAVLTSYRSYRRFLISFPLMAFIIGWGADHRHAFRGAYVIALIVGTIANYVVGTAMFCVLMNSSIAAGVTACVLPFIPTAVIKAVLATVIGFLVRKRIPGLKA